jgi:hypothetical protein
MMVEPSTLLAVCISIEPAWPPGPELKRRSMMSPENRFTLFGIMLCRLVSRTAMLWLVVAAAMEG